MNSIELLDIAKKHYKVNSDNKLAEKWKVSRVFISNIRNRRKSLPMKKAEQVAKWEGLNPTEIKREIARERAERRIMDNQKARHQRNKSGWAGWLARYFCRSERKTLDLSPAGTTL